MEIAAVFMVFYFDSFFLGNIQDLREYIENGKMVEDAVKDW